MSWLKKRVPATIAFSAPLGAVLGSVVSALISPALAWYYWLFIVISLAAVSVGLVKLLRLDRVQVPNWMFFFIVFTGMMLAGVLHRVLY